jgi:AAA domain
VPVRAVAGARDESAADLCAAEPEDTPWLVPGFIAQAAVTELDGKVKLGKTSLALDMMRGVLAGGRFLGLQCQKTSVVYMSEQGRPSFTKALRRAGLDQAATLYPIFWLEHRDLSWPELVQYAVAKCQRVGSKLLVVDTISKLAGIKQENEAGAMAAAVEPLQAVANQAQIGVLAPRHERKSGGEVGDSGRGNSQMTGDADMVVQLVRPEGNHPRNRRLLNRLSRFDDEASILIERQEDNTFVSLGEPGDFAADQFKAAILEAIPADEDIATPDLEERLNGRDDKGEPKRLTGTQRKMLAELVAEGAAKQSGEGKKAHPYLYRKAPNAVRAIRQSKSAHTFSHGDQDLTVAENSYAPLLTPIGANGIGGAADPLVEAALLAFPGAKVMA